MFGIHNLTYDNKKIKLKELAIKPDYEILSSMYFSVWETFKKKFILLLQDYFISQGFLNTSIKIEDNSSHAYIDIYFFNAKKSVKRTISLSRENLWPCVCKDYINNYSFVLRDIATGDYYGKVKPNFDKLVDAMLADPCFENLVKYNIRTNLNYPFGYDENIDVKQKQQLEDDANVMVSKLIKSAFIFEGQLYYLAYLLRSQVENINAYDFHGFYYEKSDSSLKMFFKMKDRKQTCNFDIVFTMNNETLKFKDNALLFNNLNCVTIENLILTSKSKKPEKEIVPIQQKYNDVDLYNAHVNYGNFPFTR